MLFHTSHMDLECWFADVKLPACGGLIDFDKNISHSSIHKGAKSYIKEERRK